MRLGQRVDSRASELQWYQIGTAWALWQAGYDTLQIARKLHTTEAAVYNGLIRFKRAMAA